MDDCFEEYNMLLWLPLLASISVCDVVYFLRHVNVGLQVSVF